MDGNEMLWMIIFQAVSAFTGVGKTADDWLQGTDVEKYLAQPAAAAPAPVAAAPVSFSFGFVWS